MTRLERLASFFNLADVPPPTVAFPEPAAESRTASAPVEAERRNFTLKSEEALRHFVFGTPSLSGVAVNNESLLTLPPAFAALRLISTCIAMLDRVVKSKDVSGVSVEESHPIALLMRGRPHPHYTWFDMIAAWVVNGLIGNGYILIHREEFTARPWALEHIPSGMVWPEYDIYGGLWYRIGGEINGRQVTTVVPSSDILHLKGLTTNGINGRSIALTHQPTIGAGIASQQYSASIFGKGAHPSIALKYDQPLTTTERNNARDNFVSDHGGSSNAGKPIVLDDGMDVKYLQWSPLDVALESFRNLNVEDCCRIWGVPRDFMAIDVNGTYGTAMQRSKEFLTYCLGPWLEKIQEEFNAKLFYTAETRAGSVYFEFDTSMYLAMDKETEAKMKKDEADMYALLVQNSVMTPNEVRAKYGLEPAEGGNTLFGNINYLPLENLVEVSLAKYLSSEGEKAKGVEDQAQNLEDAAEAIQDKPGAKPKTDTENEPSGQP